MSLRHSDHLSSLKPNVESGLWVFGGAMLDEPLKEGEGMKTNGSVMLAQADTQEEVLEKIKSDVYYKEGVWDDSKVSGLYNLAFAGHYTPLRARELDRRLHGCASSRLANDEEMRGLSAVLEYVVAASAIS